MEGVRAIGGFIDAGCEPRQILLRDGVNAPAAWPQDCLRPVSARVCERISNASSAPGCMAEFALPKAPPIEPERGGLILMELGDPGNLGTLDSHCCGARSEPGYVLWWC